MRTSAMPFFIVCICLLLAADALHAQRPDSRLLAALSPAPQTAPLPADDEQGDNPCGNITTGGISFSTSSYAISAAAQGLLDKLAGQMQYSPACRVVILGNGGGSKYDQQLSWDRVDAVIHYMSDKNNIDRNRFVFDYTGSEPGASEVVFRIPRNSDEEGGSSTVPPPNPGLRR